MTHNNEEIVYDYALTFLGGMLLFLGILLLIIFKLNSEKSKENPDHRSNKLHGRVYPLSEIIAATSGFDHRKIISKDVMGTIYAANMPRGDVLAVKRIHPGIVLNNPGSGFSSVIKNLSLAQHPNIVTIKGFSQAPGERIIVMELVGVVSLDTYLHENPEAENLLDWNSRLRIAAGVAKGLEYLHEQMTPNVVHGCLMASNVFLDVKFCVRICDYGLSSFLTTMESSKEILGYVDEEYLENGGSKECDVFGLGVILLELLSGRKCEGGLLLEWALPLIQEERIHEVLDSRVEVPSDTSYLVRLGEIALACVGSSRTNRPSISQVVEVFKHLEM